jgi:hypothetical protein
MLLTIEMNYIIQTFYMWIPTVTDCSVINIRELAT